MFCDEVVSSKNTSNTAEASSIQPGQLSAYVLHDTDGAEGVSSPLKRYETTRGEERKRKGVEECFALLHYLSKSSTGRCLCYLCKCVCACVCVRL